MYLVLYTAAYLAIWVTHKSVLSIIGRRVLYILFVEIGEY